MEVQVGNEGARDPAKHTAVYVICSAVSSVIPTCGQLASVNYDKRGGKITIEYKGDECNEKKDAVEAKANEICDSNFPAEKLELVPADKESIKSSEAKETGAVGGITVKKFTGKKPEPQADSTAKKASSKPKEAIGASQKTFVPFSYDNVKQVSKQMLEDIMEVLKAEGVAIEGKEDSLKAKLAGKLETPLVSLKNTAYTKGFQSNCSVKNAPLIGGFVKQR